MKPREAAVIMASNGLNLRLSEHLASIREHEISCIFYLRNFGQGAQSDLRNSTIDPGSRVVQCGRTKNVKKFVEGVLREQLDKRPFHLYAPHLYDSHPLLASLAPACKSISVVEEGLASHIGFAVSRRRRVATRLRLAHSAGYSGLSRALRIGAWPGTRNSAATHFGIGQTSFAWAKRRLELDVPDALHVLGGSLTNPGILFAMTRSNHIPLEQQLSDAQRVHELWQGRPMHISLHPSMEPNDARELRLSWRRETTVGVGIAEQHIPIQLAIGYGSSVLFYNRLFGGNSLSLSPISRRWPQDVRPWLTKGQDWTTFIRAVSLDAPLQKDDV